MKKKTMVISMLLTASLVLTGCSWTDIRAKFTGEDTSPVSGGATAGFVEDYNAADCVTVPEYKGIEVDCSVGEDEIEAEIESFLGQNAEENKIKKGKCKVGDTVNIDYMGKVDGEVFDGGSATDQSVTLGASNFIDGFDEGIRGMKVGQKKDLNLKFPDEYPNNPDLAGKDVVFTITLNYISKTKVPKLTDKLVAEKTEYKTVKEYKEGTKASLAKGKKDSAGQTAYGKVEEKAEVKTYPDSLIQTYTSQLDGYYRAMAKQYGFTDFNTFLTQSGMDETAYKSYLNDAAKANAKTQLVTKVIAEKEGVTVTDDEIKAKIQGDLSAQQGQTEEDLRKNFTELYGDKMTLEQYYRIILLTNKVIDLVGENAKITE